MKFSQRIGCTMVETVLQTWGMNDALRNSLWNVLDANIWSAPGFRGNQAFRLGKIDEFSLDLWANFFKKPMDVRPDKHSQILGEIRTHFFGCPWFEVYDFVEFVVRQQRSQELEQHVNRILEREIAGFRYISGRFVPVTDEQEVKALQEALEKGPYEGVTAHMQKAVDHLSSRENPDYRNSIKESISAVESMAKEMTGRPRASLKDALGMIEEAGRIHPALKKGLSSLYGYTSDEGGIRHAMLNEPDISATDAKFFLVSCSAFVNYLKAKSTNATQPQVPAGTAASRRRS